MLSLSKSVEYSPKKNLNPTTKSELPTILLIALLFDFGTSPCHNRQIAQCRRRTRGCEFYQVCIKKSSFLPYISRNILPFTTCVSHLANRGHCFRPQRRCFFGISSMIMSHSVFQCLADVIFLQLEATPSQHSYHGGCQQPMPAMSRLFGNQVSKAYLNTAFHSSRIVQSSSDGFKADFINPGLLYLGMNASNLALVSEALNPHLSTV